MLEFLQTYFFTGVTGNTAYDVLKKFWQQVFGKDLEELYLDAFIQAVAEQGPQLSRYGNPVELDRETLRRALRGDLAVNVNLASLSDLDEGTFIRRLAEAMADREALTMGGHNLAVKDYQEILHSLVRHATALLRQKVIEQEAAFRQILLTEVQGDRRQLVQVQGYLNTRFDLVLTRLEDIKNDTALLPDIKTTLQQVAERVETLQQGQEHHQLAPLSTAETETAAKSSSVYNTYIEQATNLAIGDKATVEIRTQADAEDKTNPPTRRQRRKQRRRELEAQWRDLTDRIEAIQQQLGVTTDQELTVTLKKRLQRLETERTQIEASLDNLESELS